MKKRLLITSIVMMLVVAVALSTATYAWFTSATTVSASSISMTAGTSSSSALGIAWSKGTSGTTFNSNYGSELENILAPAVTDDPSTANYNEATYGFQPAAPAALDVATAPVFNTAFINSQGKFITAGTATTVYRYTQDAETNASDLIHVANLAQSGAQTVYLTANITGVNAALIRIAVYEVASTTYTYKGLLSATAATDGDDVDELVDPNTAAGAIVANNDASALLTAASTTELNLGVLDAQADKAYAIYVWLDGALFDESKIGSASVSLSFSTIRTGSAVDEINAPSTPSSGD